MTDRQITDSAWATKGFLDQAYVGAAMVVVHDEEERGRRAPTHQGRVPFHLNAAVERRHATARTPRVTHSSS